MPVTRHPPHRSRRAALPHRAPASGRDAQASEEACRTQSSTCDREHPALRPAPGMLDHVSLGQLPSLHLLRRSLGATFVRRLPRYYEAVRLPAPVHHGRAPQVHRADLAITRQARCRASRVPHTVFRYMQRSPTPPGPSPPHHNGVYGVAFRVFGARRHPGLARFRGSILCLYLPLSTLRRRRYRRLRMTRGQCGWLDLHCQGLAPFTTVPACPGAYPNAGSEPPLEAVGSMPGVRRGGLLGDVRLSS
jgi:hypothetical protein